VLSIRTEGRCSADLQEVNSQDDGVGAFRVFG